jgi:general secretion pathway protein I
MRADGFTLVEVMVAIGVLGLAVLALVRLGSANIATAGHVETALFGDIVAENAIVDLLTQPQPPAFGETTTTVVNAGLEWTLLRSVERTDDPGLIRLSVVVRDASGAPAGELSAWRAVE